MNGYEKIVTAGLWDIQIKFTDLTKKSLLLSSTSEVLSGSGFIVDWEV